LQRCVRFGRSLGNELSTSRTRGTRVNGSAIEAVGENKSKISKYFELKIFPNVQLGFIDKKY